MRNLSDAALQLELEKAQRLVWTIEAEIRWRCIGRANGLGFLLKEPPALTQESCFTLLGLNAFNMARPPPPPEINAAVTNRESEGSKKKLIVLPKPNQTRYEGKRKAEAEEKNGRFEFKKKAKDAKADLKWKCELCDVLATSEEGLNDHFKGKKHTAKEKAQSRKIVSQKSTKSSLKSVVAFSRSKMEAKLAEEEEVVVDNSLNSGVQYVKKH